MKKIVLGLFIILLVIFSIIFITNRDIIKSDPIFDILKRIENDEFSINKYTIFGNHMNIQGCIDKETGHELSLILKNTKEEIVIDSEFYNEEGKTCFKLSDKNNEGINLDELKLGNYLLLVKEKLESKSNYYTLKNATEYKDLEYYTITRNKKNNKVSFNFGESNKRNYVEFKIEKTKLPDDVYDITIDPGHGGKDVGANTTFNGTKYHESELTLEIALLLKQELEEMGLKVKLTRHDDTYLSPYGEGGRAIIPNDVKSKYSLSIHLNSSNGKMSYGGVEVYVPNDVNYALATYFSDNISNIVGYSKKSTDKVANGIYYQYFTKDNIEKSKNEALEEGNKPYDIKEGAPYMFMIREVGGINTNAYNDGRNKENDINSYYNSNQTAEPYLLELAYINYSSDLNLLINATERFSHAIGSAIKEYLNIS